MFNGERYLAEVLDAVAAQQGIGAVETLVIDSGSTDASLELVRARPAVRLHRIPNEEYGHGRTRNLGARLASGRTIAFLTQDATPANSSWLRELIAPLDSPGVVGVFGLQLPRPHAFPFLQKYDIERSFATQGPPDRVSVRSLSEGAPAAELDHLAFYSDVNAASRRVFLTEELPYRDLPYSEDLAFARDALAAGHSIAYAPASVLHSNDATIGQYRRRMFDETVGQRRAGAPIPRVSGISAVAHACVGALRDSVRILRDHDYGPAFYLSLARREPLVPPRPLARYRSRAMAHLDDETLEGGERQAERVRRVAALAPALPLRAEQALRQVALDLESAPAPAPWCRGRAP